MAWQLSKATETDDRLIITFTDPTLPLHRGEKIITIRFTTSLQRQSGFPALTRAQAIILAREDIPLHLSKLNRVVVEKDITDELR